MLSFACCTSGGDALDVTVEITSEPEEVQRLAQGHLLMDTSDFNYMMMRAVTTFLS